MQELTKKWWKPEAQSTIQENSLSRLTANLRSCVFSAAIWVSVDRWHVKWRRAEKGNGESKTSISLLSILTRSFRRSDTTEFRVWVRKLLAFWPTSSASSDNASGFGIENSNYKRRYRRMRCGYSKDAVFAFSDPLCHPVSVVRLSLHSALLYTLLSGFIQITTDISDKMHTYTSRK